MALIRHTAAPLRAVRCSRTARLSTTGRAFTTTATRQGGGGPHYDPPSGWLWGVKPGEKPEPEGWEWPMALMVGGIVVAGAALAFKPDTSITTWALEEARRRLEAEGVIPDSNPGNKNDK